MHALLGVLMFGRPELTDAASRMQGGCLPG